METLKRCVPDEMGKLALVIWGGISVNPWLFRLPCGGGHRHPGAGKRPCRGPAQPASAVDARGHESGTQHALGYVKA